MKKIEIKKLRLENFMSFVGEHIIEFGHITNVFGRNATGKTTIKRAIQYVLGIKGEDGKKITGIISHDSEGNDIADGASVEITLSIDGDSYTLKREFFNTYSRKGEPTGTATDCYVDGVNKKPTEFSKWIADNILPVDALQYCMNANMFFLQDSVKQRTILEKAFSKSKDEEILKTIKDHELIEDLLKNGTVSEIKSTINKKIYGGRGRSAEIGLRQQADQIEPKIKELERQKVDEDFAELELQKADLQKRLSDIERKISGDKNDLLERKSDDIMRLKFKANDILRSASEDLMNKRSELSRKLANYHRGASDAEETLHDSLCDIEKTKNEIAKLRKEWEQVNNISFAEDNVCPTCGRPYDDDRVKEIIEKQKKAKETELSRIENDAEKEEINLKEHQAFSDECSKRLQGLKDAIKSLEDEIAKMPSEVDMTGNKEYTDLLKQIEDEEKEIDSMKNVSSKTVALEDQRDKMLAEISKVDKRLSSAEWNENIDSRIEVLEKQKDNFEIEIAQNEKALYVLSMYDRAKNECLENDVNEAFSQCSVRLFRELVNGDTEQCCEILYNGEPYSRNLNLGFTMLTEIEVCRAFQNAYEVTMPIIVDKMESLDEERLPKIDGQFICIAKTEDDELVVFADGGKTYGN